MRRTVYLLVVSMAMLSGCLRGSHSFSVDPDVTFAAHREQVLLVDRLPSRHKGELTAPGWLHSPSGPSFVLETDDGTHAGLWVVGASRVLVRRDTSTHAERIGEVLSQWDNNVIHLTIFEGDTARWTTEPFVREERGTGPSGLSRATQTSIDLRGTYRATVYDEHGKAVGWLRVRIGPYQQAGRIYDGMLPDAYADALAAATAVALDGEVTWIEEHAVNVYRGADGEPPTHIFSW